jgi:hypothetical protein
MHKMRDNIYWNDNSDPISVINLSTAGGTTLKAVWKQRKNMWYVIESESERNVIDELTPRQFHEAIETGKYHFKW